MSKGRIKAVLFIIVFLAGHCSCGKSAYGHAEREKAEATPTNDPYANTVTPSVDMQPALETPPADPGDSAVRRAYRDADARSAGTTATLTPVPTATPNPSSPLSRKARSSARAASLLYRHTAEPPRRLDGDGAHSEACRGHGECLSLYPIRSRCASFITPSTSASATSTPQRTPPR